MSYVLDSDVCIHALRGVPVVVTALQRRAPSEIAVTSITLAELWFGARKSVHAKRMRGLQNTFLASFEVLDFDAAAADAYARIRHDLERRGVPIGERDQLIAAITLARGRTLVTLNRREFDRVTGLHVVGPTDL